uniref:Integral membrane protein n=1 Tax=Streptomyces sp. NBC_00003 TaxID=2903608 RepID=A0AAU2V7X1_9ACTN
MTKRSRTFLLYVRRAAMALVAALLVVAGFWSSWGTAQHVVLTKGRDHGTLTVTRCADDVCTGPYQPSPGSSPHAGMTIAESVAARRGEHLEVVVKPGTTEAVRSGPAGILYAWLPLAGALLLAALVIGGGVRMPRTAWVTGLVGAATMAAAFIAL